MAVIKSETAQEVRELADQWGRGLQKLAELDARRREIAPDDQELHKQINSIAREFGRIGADLNEVCVKLEKEETQVDG